MIVMRDEDVQHLMKGDLPKLFQPQQAVRKNGKPKQVRAGDVLGVDRHLYKHYGIYIGHGRVIHFAPDAKDVTCIHEAPMAEFLDGASSYFVCVFPEKYGRPKEYEMAARSFQAPSVQLLSRLFQLVDVLVKSASYKLYSPADTVRRARSRIGEKGYNPMLKNCEHFALWCKTGLSESHQVEDLLQVLEQARVYVDI